MVSNVKTTGGLPLALRLSEGLSFTAAEPKLHKNTVRVWTEASERTGQRKTFTSIQIVGRFKSRVRTCFVCHAFAAVGHRHSHGARVAGSCRRLDNDDLHPCAQGGCWRQSQPTGCPASVVIDGSARYSRTGIPRSRIRALACCTVYSP